MHRTQSWDGPRTSRNGRTDTSSGRWSASPTATAASPTRRRCWRPRTTRLPERTRPHRLAQWPRHDGAGPRQRRCGDRGGEGGGQEGQARRGQGARGAHEPVQRAEVEQGPQCPVPLVRPRPPLHQAFGTTDEGGTYGAYADKVDKVLMCKTAEELKAAMYEYDAAYGAYSSAVKDYADAATRRATPSSRRTRRTTPTASLAPTTSRWTRRPSSTA